MTVKTEDLLSEITEALYQKKAVLLTGSTGVGKTYLAKRISEQLESASGQDTEAQKSLIEIQSKIAEHSTEIEQKKREIMDLLGNRASTKAKIQHFDTTKEQIQTRKAVVARNILEISTVAEGQNNRLKKYEEEYFEKKCAKSKEMITEAKNVIPGGVQHNLAFNYP